MWGSVRTAIPMRKNKTFDSALNSLNDSITDIKAEVSGIPLTTKLFSLWK